MVQNLKKSCVHAGLVGGMVSSRLQAECVEGLLSYARLFFAQPHAGKVVSHVNNFFLFRILVLLVSAKPCGFEKWDQSNPLEYILRLMCCDITGSTGFLPILLGFWTCLNQYRISS